MTRRAARILVVSVAGLGVLALAAWVLLDRSRPEAKAGRVEAPGPARTAEPASATLYFPGPGARLAGEVRALPAAGDAEARIRGVVEALLAGPEGPGLFAPLPDGVEIGSVFLAIDGTLFLDLVSGEGSANLAWGSKQELLSVYSLVNSIVANEPRAERVMLLWNGQQRPTFAGHVDMTRPLTLHSGLIARASGAG